MAVNLEQIKAVLLARFPEARVYLEDERGDGSHLFLEITSEAFVGLNKVQVHQLIYTTLKEYMSYIHALSIKATTNN